jgi:phosphate transport system permease protein
MAVTTTGPMPNALTAGRLPRGAVWMVLLGSWALLAIVFAFVQMAGGTRQYNLVGALFLGTVLFNVLLFVITFLVEGARQARDRLAGSLVATAFIIALLPLVCC